MVHAVIPAEAGIQENTGYPRLSPCRDRLLKSGKTDWSVQMSACMVTRPVMLLL